jgi:hypothetical protein
MRYAVMSAFWTDRTRTCIERNLASIRTGSPVPLSGIADEAGHWPYAKQVDQYRRGEGIQLDFPLQLDGTVRRNGTATGYGGGPYIKQKHLTVESRNMTL